MEQGYEQHMKIFQMQSGGFFQLIDRKNLL